MKDIRNILYTQNKIYITFENYTRYSKFCDYVDKILLKSNIVYLYKVLKFMRHDYNFKNAFYYGWYYKDIIYSLLNATNFKYKYKKKLKHNKDFSYPINIILSKPIKIRRNK